MCYGKGTADKVLLMPRCLRRFLGMSTAASSMCWRGWLPDGWLSQWGSWDRGAATILPIDTSAHSPN